MNRGEERNREMRIKERKNREKGELKTGKTKGQKEREKGECKRELKIMFRISATFMK